MAPDQSGSPEIQDQQTAVIKVRNEQVVTIATTMDAREPILKQRRQTLLKKTPAVNACRKTRNKNIKPIHWIDRVSRVLFPILYTIFLAGYWLHFLNEAAIGSPIQTN